MAGKKKPDKPVRIPTDILRKAMVNIERIDPDAPQDVRDAAFKRIAHDAMIEADLPYSDIMQGDAAQDACARSHQLDAEATRRLREKFRGGDEPPKRGR